MSGFLNEKQREVIRDWWYALQPRAHDAAKPRGEFVMFTRADRAEIRRCEEPVQVLLEESFMRLYKALKSSATEGRYITFGDDPTPYAVMAGVIAWVKEDLKDRSSFAAKLGEQVGDRPRMSKLRFARLQTAQSEEEFFLLARRAVHLVGGEADVAQLGEELLAWVWEFRGNQPDKPKDRIRVRWATNYFEALL